MSGPSTALLREGEREATVALLKGSAQECGIYYVQLNLHQGNAHYAPSSSLIFFFFNFIFFSISISLGKHLFSPRASLFVLRVHR